MNYTELFTYNTHNSWIFFGHCTKRVTFGDLLQEVINHRQCFSGWVWLRRRCNERRRCRCWRTAYFRSRYVAASHVLCGRLTNVTTDRKHRQFVRWTSVAGTSGDEVHAGWRFSIRTHEPTYRQSVLSHYCRLLSISRLFQWRRHQLYNDVTSDVALQLGRRSGRSHARRFRMWGRRQRWAQAEIYLKKQTVNHFPLNRTDAVKSRQLQFTCFVAAYDAINFNYARKCRNKSFTYLRSILFLYIRVQNWK